MSLEHLRRYPHAFSGGQRQRIGIARALVVQPQFVVCDEPVSALDVSIPSQILNLLMDMQQELGLTYLFVAHNLSVVEHVSDRVAVMYLGKLVELAPTTALFISRCTRTPEALMSAIPSLDPDEVDEARHPRRRNCKSGRSTYGLSLSPALPLCTSDLQAGRAREWKEYQPDHFAACHFAGTLPLKGAVKA